MKVNGYRIELAEIDAVLSAVPGVSAVVTLVRPLANLPTLCSYVSGSFDLESLREHAEARLPAHMLPQLVPLAAMPLTVNGKIDQAALPLPQQQPPVSDGSGEQPPANDTEAKLLAIFRRLLSNSGLGVDSGFFHSGGDSIAAIQAVSAARQAGLLLTVADLFKRPTVRSLAPLCRPVPSEPAPLKVCPSLFVVDLFHSPCRGSNA